MRCTLEVAYPVQDVRWLCNYEDGNRKRKAPTEAGDPIDSGRSGVITVFGLEGSPSDPLIIRGWLPVSPSPLSAPTHSIDLNCEH
jgi:hypothetical protein